MLNYFCCLESILSGWLFIQVVFWQIQLLWCSYQSRKTGLSCDNFGRVEYIVKIVVSCSWRFWYLLNCIHHQFARVTLEFGLRFQLFEHLADCRQLCYSPSFCQGLLLSPQKLRCRVMSYSLCYIWADDRYRMVWKHFFKTSKTTYNLIKTILS